MFSADYHHRKEQDGTYSSICPVCFMTVATRSSEEELKQDEQQHLCKRPISPDPRWRKAPLSEKARGS